MRIKMQTMLAGLDPRETSPRPLCIKPGAVADLPEAFARELIARGYAEAVSQPVVAEVPLPPAVVTPKGGKRGGKGHQPAVTDAAAGS